MAWQDRKDDKSTYLFSLFYFSLNLLNRRVLTSFAHSPPYITQKNLSSVLQRSSSTFTIFTKSCHHFLKTRFSVHCFPTCCFSLVEKWRGVNTPDKGLKTDQSISVVFFDLNIWHSHYLSSCNSATIKDQVGRIKQNQCHDKDVCVSRMRPDDD